MSQEDEEEVITQETACDEELDCTPRPRNPFRYKAATERVLSRFPCLLHVPLASDLCQQFGVYMVTCFAMVYFFSKGMTAHILSGTALPMFKDEFGLDIVMYQKYVSVGVLAWSLKPAIGVASDLISVNGYHKRWYLVGSSLMCCLLLMLYALIPGSKMFIPAAGVVFFCANFCCAMLDLLPEGRYSELMNLKPRSSSSLVSWVWTFVMLGGGFAALLQGPLADAGHPRISLLVAAVAQACLFFPLYQNWLGDRRDAQRRSNFFAVNESRLTENRSLVLFSLLMAVGTVSISFSTMLLNKEALMLVCVIVTTCLSVVSFRVLPVVAAKANLFMFLKELLYLQLPGPLDYFYTAPESCLPDGPHFSYFFYQTFTVVIGYAAGALGVALFHRFLAKRDLRLTFLVTTCVKVIASGVDIAIVKRWNVAFGLEDKWTYFLGDAIVFGACQMLDFMPAVILISKLCPPGFESTLYALLAGFSNLGQALSNTCGAVLVELVWPLRTQPPCDFSNLTSILAFGHLFLPLLIAPLSLMMVPKSSTDMNE